MQIKINKDFETAYRDELFRGFSTRQTVSIGIAGAVSFAVSAYAWKVGVPLNTCVYVGFPFMLPILTMGFFEIQGLTPFQYAKEMWYCYRTRLLLYDAGELPAGRKGRVFAMDSRLSPKRKPHAGARHRKEKKMNPDKKKNMKKNMFLLILGLALLIGLLVWNSHRRDDTLKRMESEKETKKEEGNALEGDTEQGTQTEEQSGTEGWTEEGTEAAATEQEATEKTEPQTEAAQEEAVTQYDITVTNKEEFAKDVMATKAYLLDKQLTAYAQKRKWKATEGKILDVAIPEDNLTCTEFYVQVNNKKKSLVTLTWNPYQCQVTAKKCQYTLQEIEDMVWLAPGPEQRGISQKEDAQFLEGEETDG